MSEEKTVSPYGAWASPLPAEKLVQGVATLNTSFAAGGITWWSELRPDEGGRFQLVRREPDGSVRDLLPEGWNVRTRVHEYGGGAWWVDPGPDPVETAVVYFTQWEDQRLYRLETGGSPEPITEEPGRAHAWRYADGRVTPDRRFVVCVREAHPDDGGEARNEVVAIPATGGPADVLVAGPDFVAAPRISPDGSTLVWLEWDHPDMPWTRTRLHSARLSEAGGALTASDHRHLAGGERESLVQPEWGPEGQLWVLSDRAEGWWNVHRVLGDGALEVVHPVAAEVGRPAWTLGQSRYVPVEDDVVLTWSGPDGAHLVTSEHDHVIEAVSLQSLSLDSDGSVVAIATHTDSLPDVVAIDPTTGSVAVRRPAVATDLPAEAISHPQRIDYPSADGRTAHAWYYPPTSADFVAPEGELPPLLVQIHGGPTSAADPALKLGPQYWTTRGFAYVDVDYGGSTGYGRAYRELLDGQWGIVDVQDACAAATWLGEQGLADPQRLAISGGSAGGYTVLACLAREDVFAAGASYFGVADATALAADTHKFESRYLDSLIGPWPEAEATYVERSPITHVDGFDRPLLVLQGLEDEIVPPAQAEAIVAALDGKGVPHAYLPFEGEQHGFRRAETVIRAVTGELYFYSRVFGFTPADDIDPVDIRHAHALG